MDNMDTDVRVLTWYMKILCASDGLKTSAFFMQQLCKVVSAQITNSMLCQNFICLYFL